MSDGSQSSDDLLNEARDWLEPSGSPTPARPETVRPDSGRPNIAPPETARSETSRPDSTVPELLESTLPRSSRPTRQWAPADPFRSGTGTSTAAGTSAEAHAGPIAPSPYPSGSPPSDHADPSSLPATPVPPTHGDDGRGAGRFPRFVIRLVIFLLIVGGFALYRAATNTETAPVDELRIGTCFEDPGVGLVNTIEPVDCDQSHDLEVFAIVQLPFAAGVAMPPDDDLFDRAYDECLPPFERYTGEQYVDSEYYIDALVPDVRAWKAGDREAVCFLFLIDANSEIVPAAGSARV